MHDDGVASSARTRDSKRRNELLGPSGWQTALQQMRRLRLTEGERRASRIARYGECEAAADDDGAAGAGAIAALEGGIEGTGAAVHAGCRRQAAVSVATFVAATVLAARAFVAIFSSHASQCCGFRMPLARVAKETNMAEPDASSSTRQR